MERKINTRQEEKDRNGLGWWIEEVLASKTSRMIRATTEQGANSSGRAEIKLKDTKKQVEKAKKNSAAACPRSAERARYDSVRSAKVGAERHQHLVLCLCPHAHLLAS
jgi:hypothetical protein